jgi:VanZ family protein
MGSKRLHLFLFSLTIILLSSIPGHSLDGKLGLGYDKIIHFVEYSILGFFCHRSGFRIYNSSYYFTLIFGFSFSIFDEFWQSFVPGRNSSILDVIADLLGICFISFIHKFTLPFKK